MTGVNNNSGLSKESTVEDLLKMAKAYLRLDDTNNAELVLKAALHMQQNHYGPNHLLTLQTHEDLLSVQEKILDKQFIVFLRNKANDSLRAGDSAGAKIMLREVLSLQEEHYGNDHAQTLKTQKQLTTINGLLKFDFFNSKSVKADAEPNYCTIAPRP